MRVLVLLDVWMTNFNKKNVGIHIANLVNGKNQVFVYCSHSDDFVKGVEFIQERIPKGSSRVLFMKRFILT